ncbi:hypothetical protein E3P84_01001 [Wallemia ichthyophaga]|nr:hypothetical protein E3P84_01001 [Wallemia ichthyophaga]TIB42780.1 hypothetical protein E3P83_01046 [Wallemia ichthyophaga]
MSSLSFYHLLYRTSEDTIFNSIPSDEWMSTPMDLPEILRLPPSITPRTQPPLDLNVHQPPKKRCRGLASEYDYLCSADFSAEMCPSPSPLPRRKKSADLKANGSTTHQSKISKQASNEWKNIKMTRSVSKKLKRESTEVDGDDMLWPLSTASAPVPEKIYFNGEGWRTYCQIMGLSLGN